MWMEADCTDFMRHIRLKKSPGQRHRTYGIGSFYWFEPIERRFNAKEDVMEKRLRLPEKIPINI